MATFLDIFSLASDQAFQNRVHTAAAKSAIAIMGEAIGSMTAIQTAKRQQMAAAVLQNATNWLNWALSVANNPSITSGSNDGDIEFTVNSIWDKMSGVTTADLVPE